MAIKSTSPAYTNNVKPPQARYGQMGGKRNNCDEAGREVVVMNIPFGTPATLIRDFFVEWMVHYFLCPPNSTPIVTCWIDRRARYAVLVFASAKYATRALDFNGIYFLQEELQIQRRCTYDGPHPHRSTMTFSQLLPDKYLPEGIERERWMNRYDNLHERYASAEPSDYGLELEEDYIRKIIEGPSKLWMNDKSQHHPSIDEETPKERGKRLAAEYRASKQRKGRRENQRKQQPAPSSCETVVEKRNEQEIKRGESSSREDMINELFDDMAEEMSMSDDMSWYDEPLVGQSQEATVLAWPPPSETITMTRINQTGEDNHLTTSSPPLNDNCLHVSGGGSDMDRDISELLVGDCLEDEESSDTASFEPQQVQTLLPTIGTTLLDFLPTHDHCTNKYMLKTNKECIRNCKASPRGKDEEQFTLTSDERATDDTTSLAAVPSGSYEDTNNSLDGVEASDELPSPRKGTEDDTISLAVVSTGSYDTTDNICDGVKAPGGLTQLQNRSTLRRKRKQRLSRINVRLQQLGMNSTTLEAANGDKKSARATCQRKMLQWEVNGSIFTTKVDIARFEGVLADGKLEEIICHFRKRGL